MQRMSVKDDERPSVVEGRTCSDVIDEGEPATPQKDRLKT